MFSLRGFALPAICGVFFFGVAAFVSIRQAVLFLVGIGLGSCLAAARFGFTTGWRELVRARDPRGVFGQALLLLLASAMALPLLSQFEELQSAAGPIGVSLLVGAFVFGASMQIADGCGSGTLYKAGMGYALNMGILPLFALGSFLGSVHLPFWLSLGSMSPILLLDHFDAGLSFTLTASFLIGLLVMVRLYVGPSKIWIKANWVYGAIGLAIFATINLILAGQPWGVVYGFGLWAAKLAAAGSLFDPSQHSFWGAAQHQERLRESVLLDVTSMTNIGILAGAYLIQQWKQRSDIKASTQQTPRLSPKQWIIALLAGLIMGYSSRLAFGCNVGAMLSGISTGSLHGWIWLCLAFCGTLIGIRLRERYGF
jgi:uncharacterized membrane protein YedE/YeeE